MQTSTSDRLPLPTANRQLLPRIRHLRRLRSPAIGGVRSRLLGSPWRLRRGLPLLLLLALGQGQAQTERGGQPHEQLDAVLWVQQSAEYQAAALQAYNQARAALDMALADTTWTAALEQTGPFGQLPPAVILDVDETALDNSPHQGRLILGDMVFNRASWDRWVKEELAEPVPGALQFCQYAALRGVTVFYVTNRRDHLREATRNNLRKMGFPLADDRETLFTRGDISAKGPRRAAIAQQFRILLLLGDNTADFAPGFRGAGIDERAALTEQYADWWGRRWIMLPNPMYGSWEEALPGFDYSQSRSERVRAKRRALQD